MTEPWRRKSYYAPRVLVDSARVISSTAPGQLVCLDGAHLELIRNLLAYAHRRSTFVSEYHDGYYVAPSSAEWNAIEKTVAELESRLMGCKEIEEALLSISESIECICSRMQNAASSGISAFTGGIVAHYVDNGSVTYDYNHGPGTTVLDADRCAVANICWAGNYEILTEYLIPLQDHAVDALAPLAVGALGTMIGGPVLGISLAALMSLTSDFIDVFVASEQENLTNAYMSYRDEIVCAIYDGLAVDTATAAAAAAAVVDTMDISPIDKALMAHFLSTHWVDKFAQAWDNQTAWAIANAEGVNCSGCGLIVGSDWYAAGVRVPDGDIELDHSAPGQYWAKASVCGVNRGEIVAYVGELIEHSGDCPECSWNNEASVSCTGSTISSTHSIIGDNPPVAYVYRQYTHNDDEAVAVLCPTATKHVSDLGGNWAASPWAIQASLGWSCTGTALVRVKYIVYAGAP